MIGTVSGVEGKAGRPRKGEVLQEELFRARGAARNVLISWKQTGLPGPIFQVEAFVGPNKATDNEGKARLNKWFPLMVVKRMNAKDWDLGILEIIMAWDDPVMMLKRLVRDNPAGWAEALHRYQAEACPEAMEDAIREALKDLDGKGPTYFQGTIDDPEKPVGLIGAFKVFSDNWRERPW